MARPAEGFGWRGVPAWLTPMCWSVDVEGRRVEWAVQRRRAGEGALELELTACQAPTLRAKCTAARKRNPSGVVLQVVLENRGEQPVIITALRPLDLPIPERDLEVLSVSGGATFAFYPPPAWQPSVRALRRGHSDELVFSPGPDGRSSTRDLPIFALRAGRWGIGGGLEWSGLWRAAITAEPRWRVEIPVNGLRLEPGEELELPAVHLAAARADSIWDAANAVRRYIYRHIIPRIGARRPLPPVSYDHWFGVGIEFDCDFLCKQAEVAAELGCEYFVLDAGWYAGCERSFVEGVGNWMRVDLNRFPDGIEPLAEKVRSLGMKFGLWFDIERAHRKSDAARQHPEFFIDIGAEFLHLDLSRRDAQDWVIETVGYWISRLDLRWSRWDYNIGPAPYFAAVDSTGKYQFAYVRGLYRVLDELMCRFPQWMVECCASGGRRVDLGTLRRAHTAWFSDHTDDPDICRAMQIGANHLLPGNIPNSSIPARLGRANPAPSLRDVASRMCGALSFDGDIACWPPQFVRSARRLVDAYKSFRHLLVEDFYPLTPPPQWRGDVQIALFARRDKREAVLLAFGPAGSRVHAACWPLRGDVRYRVMDPLSRRGRTCSGRELAERGLQVRLADGFAIRLFEVA